MKSLFSRLLFPFPSRRYFSFWLRVWLMALLLGPLLGCCARCFSATVSPASQSQSIQVGGLTITLLDAPSIQACPPGCAACRVVVPGPPRRPLLRAGKIVVRGVAAPVRVLRW